MAFDKTLPTTTQKIRTLSSAITPNWVAIEEGDSTFKPQAINHDNRTPLAAANNPTAIAEAYITYCKDDPSANPELFGIDQDSVISQLTFTDRSLAQSGYSYLAPGFLLQWGRATITGGGSTKAVTFPKAFGATAYSVVATLLGTPSSDSSRGFGVTSITDLGFSGNNYNSGFTGNTDFTYIAIGPV